MSSDKKRIERDLFGDEDDEDDLIQSEDRNHEDRDQEQGDADKDYAQEGEAEEEEEEGVPLPSFKKRNADGSSPAPEAKKRKIIKKAKPARDGAQENQEGGEDLPLDPRQVALLKLERDFETALKSGKSSSRRRKKDDEDIDTELDESASRFVAKMRQAAIDDDFAKVDRQPALAKTRMLDSVKKQLNKSHVHNTFLDNGILEPMRTWLEPSVQDASLPSLDIIQDFLDLLDVLPIQTDHLVNSGVGRVVYFYTKVDDSRVTPSIKRKANALVDKWSRPIVKLSQDYRDKKINYADDNLAAAASQRRRPNMASSSAAEAPGPKTLGVRVPTIDRGSYALMPESSIAYDKSRGGKLYCVDIGKVDSKILRPLLQLLKSESTEVLEMALKLRALHEKVDQILLETLSTLYRLACQNELGKTAVLEAGVVEHIRESILNVSLEVQIQYLLKPRLAPLGVVDTLVCCAAFSSENAPIYGMECLNAIALLTGGDNAKLRNMVKNSTKLKSALRPAAQVPENEGTSRKASLPRRYFLITYDPMSSQQNQFLV
ncbi:Transcription factor iws1 [Mortierella sp. AD094]|nr:Transcription factor iws1 [Mortierella sp. AD094]